MEREDYLEAIYNLDSEVGQVRISDIARVLNVRKPSVTQMMQRLQEEGFVVYEPYLHLKLTIKGRKIARNVSERHKVLENFLTLLKVPERIRKKDIHGMEHCLSPITLKRLKELNTFLEKNKFRQKD